MPGAGVAHQGPNGNPQLYRSLFSASQDARFLGLAGSETESGQSGLQETRSHKPPQRMGRSLTSQAATGQYRGLLHAEVSAWCAARPPNVAIRSAARIFRNVIRCQLPGAPPPSRSLRKDVACVSATDHLTQVALASCVLPPCWTGATLAVALGGALARPVHLLHVSVQPMLYNVLLYYFRCLILNRSPLRDTLTQVGRRDVQLWRWHGEQALLDTWQTCF